MGLSDASEWFICKTKTFHIADSRGPSCSPPGGEQSVPVPALPWLNSPWAALICMHTAFLTEHSTQARKDEKKRKKRREKETKSYFYGKLRSDCGAISQVHLNKSIKAYPNTKGKKKSSNSLSHHSFFPFTFGSQNCGQAFVQVFI